MSKSKYWCYTLNNYTKAELKKLKEYKCVYHIIGDENAPSTGTPHLQGYFEFNSEKKKTTLIKAFPNASFRITMGSGEDNKIYCSKENKIFEYGEPTKIGRGTRTDLINLRDDILNGKKVDEICLENPDKYHQYGRTISKIEDLRMRKVFRKEMTQGYLYWGESGTGKSELAFENFNPDTHYVWKYEKWQDGYTQQETVILDEFRDQLSFKELLRLVDKHPNYYCFRRNREPMPFTSKKVIITSACPPEDLFMDLRDSDSLEQFNRRFIVKEFKKQP